MHAPFLNATDVILAVDVTLKAAIPGDTAARRSVSERRSIFRTRFFFVADLGLCIRPTAEVLGLVPYWHPRRLVLVLLLLVGSRL